MSHHGLVDAQTDLDLFAVRENTNAPGHRPVGHLDEAERLRATLSDRGRVDGPVDETVGKSEPLAEVVQDPLPEQHGKPHYETVHVNHSEWGHRPIHFT